MANLSSPSSLISRSSVFLLLLLFGFVSANDDCSEATVVTSLPFVATGDTTDATADFPTPTDRLGNLTCGVSTSSRGVWYRIQDQENLFVRATLTPTTDVRFKTALFQADNQEAENCQDSLTCMRTSAYYLSPPTSSDNGDIVSEWFVESGSIYYLHVTGATEDDIGSFQLQIENLNTVRPVNDRCDTALPLDNMEAGSVGAWPGFENEECGIRSTSRGLYFGVVNGEDVQQGRSVKVSGFEHVLEEGGRFEIAVLSGDDCSTCVTYQDFLFDDSESYTVQWMAQPNVEYTVLVAGEDYADVGSFVIELEPADGANFGDAGLTSDLNPLDGENNAEAENGEPGGEVPQRASSARDRAGLKSFAIHIAAIAAFAATVL